jgi:uncharacterized RDD family membrane protein YckC
VAGAYGYHVPYVAQSSAVYASAGARVIAYIIDAILAGIAAFILVVVGVVIDAAMDSSGFTILMYLTALVASFVFFIGFEATSGATPGKRLLGIKVVKDDGSPMDWGAAIIRNLLRIVDYLPFWYLLGFLLVVFQTRKQRIGDMAARTLVVKA